MAREYWEQALTLATELGIQLVAECQKVWEELEDDVIKHRGAED